MDTTLHYHGNGRPRLRVPRHTLSFPVRSGASILMNPFDSSVSGVTKWLRRVEELNAGYRAGDLHVNVPAALHESQHPLDELLAQHLPASHAAFEAAARGLFFSLPVAFDPAESAGPYLAIVDRDPDGRPYRFLDMGALIATQALGENDPILVRAVLDSLPFAVSRYAHSEYQTILSLRLKA